MINVLNKDNYTKEELIKKINALNFNVTKLNKEIKEIQDSLGNMDLRDLDKLLLIIPTYDLTADINRIRELMTNQNNQNIETTIRNINTSLNNVEEGSTIVERISDIDSTILISPSGIVSTDIDTVSSLLRSTLYNTQGEDFEFISYSGSESQLFNNEACSSPADTIINLDIDNLAYVYTYTGSISVNGIITFLTGDVKKLILKSKIGVEDISTLVTKINEYLNTASICSNKLERKITYLKDNIYPSSSSIQDAVDNLDHQLVNVTSGSVKEDLDLITTYITTSSGGVLVEDILNMSDIYGATPDDFYSKIYSTNSILDGVKSMSETTLTVTQAATISDPNISMSFESDSYVIDISVINLGDGTGGTSSIPNGGTFTLTKGGDTITFYNMSGSDITSATALKNYLADSYPVGSIISKQTYGKIESVKEKIYQSSDTLQSSLNNVKSLISLNTTSTLQTDINNINSSIDGVESMVGITTFTFTTVAANSGGTISIAGQDDDGQAQLYSFDFIQILGGGSFTFYKSDKSITFCNTTSSPISSAVNLVSYLNEEYKIGTIVKSTTLSKLISFDTMIGGNLNNLTSNISNIATSVLRTPVELRTDLSTLIDRVNGSETILETGIDSLSTALFNNTTYSPPLFSQINNLNYSIDNGLNRLPNGYTFITITSIASDKHDNSIINMVTNSGTYTFPFSSVSLGGVFVFSGDSGNIELYNMSGSKIDNSSTMLNYLKSMYPGTSKLSFSTKEGISNLNKMIGGNTSITRVGLSKLNRSLLELPTGNISTDLTTIRQLIISSNGSTLEDNIKTINSLLDGNSIGSTITNRIGAPLCGGAGSTISSILGGTETNIADKIGDPSTGLTGISALIKASTVSGNIIFSDTSLFKDSTNIISQLTAFIDLFNPDNWTSNGTTIISFDFPSAPTCLADIINAAIAQPVG